MPLFTEIAIVLIVAALTGLLANLLRQPIVVGYIAAGLAIGALGYLGSGAAQILSNLSSIGIALLLFVIGLDIDIEELAKVGFSTLIIGLGQIIITFALGFLLASHFGFDHTQSFFTAVVLTFSSTVIIVKLLADKGDLSSLYGRIALGVSLLQDLLAIALIIFLAGLHTSSGGSSTNLFLTLLKGVVFVVLILLSAKILPKILDLFSRSRELLYLFGLAWALGIAALAGSSLVGLSIEVGGFLAGLALAHSSEQFEISAELRPLRDFFLILFFVGLGASALTDGRINFLELIAFSLFVLLVKPLIVFLIMSLSRYRARTSFFTSASLAQASEFSFILFITAQKFGYLDNSSVALGTSIGVITIFLSSYLIVFSSPIYDFLRPVLKVFERRGLKEEKGEKMDELAGSHIVLVGAHRMGRNILKALAKTGEKFVAVDFDPEVIKNLRGAKTPAIYGDIADLEIQELAGFKTARLVISTVPDFKENAEIVSVLRRINKDARTILTAQNERDARRLYLLGADYVLLPHFVGGDEIAKIIDNDPSLEKLEDRRNHDLSVLGIK